jgi:hydroxymethylglutaryl-CoA reductase (NADPH)
MHEATSTWSHCWKGEERLSSAAAHYGGGSRTMLLQRSRPTRLAPSYSTRLTWPDMVQASQHLALTTLIFPDSLSSSSQLAPLVDAVPVPANISAKTIPSTPNVLSAISQDSSLSFSMPYTAVSDFLKAVQEIPGRSKSDNGDEDKMWIMKAARFNGHGSRRTYRAWLSDGWSSLVDLIKVWIVPSPGSIRLTWQSMRRH